MIECLMNVYKQILLTPKRAFENRAFNKEKQPLLKLPFFIMIAILSFDVLPEIGFFAKENPIWSLLITIVISAGVTFLMLGLVVPGLIKLFGYIWKGEATMRQMVNVSAASYFPFILILIYQLSMFALGQETISHSINSGVNYVIWLWSLSLFIIGVAKVQGFSYGTALLNILISYTPFIVIGVLWG